LGGHSFSKVESVLPSKHTRVIFTFADGKIYGKYYPTMTLVQLHKDDGDWDCGPCYTFEKCPKCTSTIKPCLTELTAERIQQGIKKCLNLEKIFPGA
jgi:hypothetical protein